MGVIGTLRPLIDTCKNVRLAQPITSPVRQRTGFSKSRGLSASVSFLPLPYPHRSFVSSRPIFRAGQIPKTPFLGLSLLPNPTETLATQANRMQGPDGIPNTLRICWSEETVRNFRNLCIGIMANICGLHVSMHCSMASQVMERVFFQFYELSMLLNYQIYFGTVAASKVSGVS